ncbi:hypothetical protein AGMMS50267_11860 [Spirochaetia bacterium]|nr:hypothetical protein AGMMS50267_11860 [Spirochaetia bacterium]
MIDLKTGNLFHKSTPLGTVTQRHYTSRYGEAVQYISGVVFSYAKNALDVL